MQIRTGFSPRQGSELQGISTSRVGELVCSWWEIFVSFLALHLIQSSNTWVPGVQPGCQWSSWIRTRLLCACGHIILSEMNQERKQEEHFFFFKLTSVIGGDGFRAGAGACWLEHSARNSFLQKWPLVSVYPNCWGEGLGNACHTLTRLSLGSLCVLSACSGWTSWNDLQF